jgi:hypothetical protein
MATSLIITRKPKKAALLNAVIKQPRVAITHGYETLLKCRAVFLAEVSGEINSYVSELAICKSGLPDDIF